MYPLELKIAVKLLNEYGYSNSDISKKLGLKCDSIPYILKLADKYKQQVHEQILDSSLDQIIDILHRHENGTSVCNLANAFNLSESHIEQILKKSECYKKIRKVLTDLYVCFPLETKIEVIHLHENGDSISDIAKKFKTKHQIIRSIIRDAAKYKEMYKKSADVCMENDPTSVVILDKAHHSDSAEEISKVDSSYPFKQKIETIQLHEDRNSTPSIGKMFETKSGTVQNIRKAGKYKKLHEKAAAGFDEENDPTFVVVSEKACDSDSAEEVSKADSPYHLKQKIEMIQLHQDGNSVQSIASKFEALPKTVSYIVKNADKIKKEYKKSTGIEIYPETRIPVLLGKKETKNEIKLKLNKEVIRLFESGNSKNAISKILRIGHQKVSTILKEATLPELPKTILLEIEDKLKTWFANEARKGYVIDFETFRLEAESIYTSITNKSPMEVKYVVDTELFDFCKAHFTVAAWDCSVDVMHGYKQNMGYDENGYVNSKDESGCANNEAYKTSSKAYVDYHFDYSVDTVAETFQEIYEKGNYSPCQIFCVRETCLFWKHLPIKDVNSKLTRKDFVENVTLLLGCNATGDFKLKPLVINLTENPKALSGFPKDKLPVIWKSNKKGIISQMMFCDWFTGYFCPAVEQYCIEKHLENKVLLVIDSSSTIPRCLDDLSSNVSIFYVPQDSSTVLFPMNVTFMKTVKAKYQYTVLSKLMAKCECVEIFSFDSIWESYDIKMALNNITEAWIDIKAITLNRLWFQLLPSSVIDFFTSVDNVENIFEEISLLAKALNLGTINMQYYLEELDFGTKEIAAEWLELNRLCCDDLDNVIPVRFLSASKLGEAMRSLEIAMTIFLENDPDSERSHSVCSFIKNSVADYRHLIREKRKSQNSPIKSSFKKRHLSTAGVLISSQSNDSKDPETSYNDRVPNEFLPVVQLNVLRI